MGMFRSWSLSQITAIADNYYKLMAHGVVWIPEMDIIRAYKIIGLRMKNCETWTIYKHRQFALEKLKEVSFPHSATCLGSQP